VEKISVLVPAGNEEENIVECLESVQWADEVLVVDSFSEDKTVELATPLATRVIQHEYENSAAQKNWAIPQLEHDWAMVLDSDERVTPELAEEIQAILSESWDESKPAAYRIWRKNHFLGKPVNYCGWQNDDVIRLFRRDKAKYIDRHVHADLDVDGEIAPLKHKLLHYTFRSFDQYMKKFDQYTTWAASDRAKKTKRVGISHLVGRPIVRFFKQYILKQGFRDGRTGLIICLLSAFSVFLKYAKLWEQKTTSSRDS
jgi:glycosyltransferase involved in cell wall biosynthesis